MLNLLGHKVTICGASAEFADEVESAGLSREGISAIVVGEDLASALILAFDEEGEVVYKNDALTDEIAAKFEKGAQAIISAIETEQAEATADAS